METGAAPQSCVVLEPECYDMRSLARGSVKSMPLGNFVLVRRLRDAWSHFSPDRLAGFYSADAGIVSPRRDLFGHIYRGHEGLRRSISEFADAFDRPAFKLEELVEARDFVIEVVPLSTRGRQGGIEVRRRIASTYTVRDWLISKQVIYVDRADALAAAGLAAPAARTGGDCA